MFGAMLDVSSVGGPAGLKSFETGSGGTSSVAIKLNC